MKIKQVIKSIVPNYIIDNCRKKKNNVVAEKFYIENTTLDCILRDMKRHAHPEALEGVLRYHFMHDLLSEKENANNKSLYLRTIDIVNGEKGDDRVTFDWFVKHHFNAVDRIRVLRGYADIHTNCMLLVLYGADPFLWDKAVEELGRHICVIGYADWDFAENQKAFHYILDCIKKESTEFNSDKKNIIFEKSGYVMRFILISSESTDAEYTLEKEVTKLLKIQGGGYLIPRSNRSNDWLIQNLLSVNNLKHMELIDLKDSESFDMRLLELEKYLLKKGIPKNDICLVGSSVLEVCGIRESNDLDIIIAKESAKDYAECAVKLTKTNSIEKVGVGWLRIGNKTIPDDQLVFDYDCHFWYHGFKFVNLDYVRLKKNICNREKDKKDMKLITKFYEIKGLSGKEIL